jgi:hypothetical protein
MAECTACFWAMKMCNRWYRIVFSRTDHMKFRHISSAQFWLVNVWQAISAPTAVSRHGHLTAQERLLDARDNEQFLEDPPADPAVIRGQKTSNCSGEPDNTNAVSGISTSVQLGACSTSSFYPPRVLLGAATAIDGSPRAAPSCLMHSDASGSTVTVGKRTVITAPSRIGASRRNLGSAMLRGALPIVKVTAFAGDWFAIARLVRPVFALLSARHRPFPAIVTHFSSAGQVEPLAAGVNVDDVGSAVSSNVFICIMGSSATAVRTDTPVDLTTNMPVGASPACMRKTDAPENEFGVLTVVVLAAESEGNGPWARRRYRPGGEAPSLRSCRHRPWLHPVRIRRAARRPPTRSRTSASVALM